MSSVEDSDFETKQSLIRKIRSSRFVVALDIVYVFGMYTIFAFIHVITTLVMSYIPFVKRLVKRPLLTKEYIWRRYYYSRIHDCWNRTVTSRAGIWMDVEIEDETKRTRRWRKRAAKIGAKSHNLSKSRSSSQDSKSEEYSDPSQYPFNGEETKTSKSKRCLNFGSYNYLGFADSPKHVIEEDLDALSRYGNSSCTPFTAPGGYMSIHRELEKEMAKFLGKEDAFIFAMGFATNSTAIPLLISKGGLIISDSMNHSSIVTGCRDSGARVKTFKHNDMEDLERVIRAAIVSGEYKVILIIVEGVYSMEGDMCNLPAIARLKFKYNCKLYIDEAHSIGSIGKTGRGITDYYSKELMDEFGTKDVADILMGTFTKSFASVGGYIAASKDIISKVRSSWEGGISMTPMAAQQIVSALHLINSKEDTRIRDLEENTKYLRSILRKTHMDVLGADPDELHGGSPVVPIRTRNPLKMAWVSRTLLRYSIGIVVVGYPAVPINENRIRLCVSSSLTKRDMDYAVKVISSLV